MKLEPKDVSFVILRITSVICLIEGFNYFYTAVMAWWAKGASEFGMQGITSTVILVHFITAICLFALGHIVWAKAHPIVRKAAAVEEKKTAVLSLCFAISGIILLAFSLPFTLHIILVVENIIHMDPFFASGKFWANPRILTTIFVKLFTLVTILLLIFKSKKLAGYITRINPQNGGFHKWFAANTFKPGWMNKENS